MKKDHEQTGAAIRRIEDLLRGGRAADAAREAQTLTAAQPQSVEGWILLGRALQASGTFDHVLAAARRAIAIDAAHPGARLLFVEALLQAGFGEEGRAELASLELASGRDGRMLQHIGQLYTHLGAHEAAARVYHQAVSLAPSNASYLYNLATAQIGLGNLTEAERLLDRVIALAPEDYDAWYNRSTLRRQTPERNHVVQLEHMLAARLRHPAGGVPLNYALAKEYEDLGKSAESFAALRKGADLRRKMLAYKVEDDIATLEAIARAFTTDVFNSAQRGHDDPRPLFVLGLPRSGTTLVDRILSSHSRVRSLGERSDFAVSLVRQAGASSKANLIERSATLDFAALGRAYCGSVVGGQEDGLRLIDKTPVNFLYLGLIALSLPNARIVHVRRNAMDVCYAMYKTLFRMAYPFSYDLSDLAKYYLAYDRLMTHWREVLPGRFVEIEYEALVADQETESRRLIAGCGLEWEEACLHFERNSSPSLTASAAQARQPIYASSVGLWKRYADELDPLAELLRKGGVSVA
ncbi:MAG TPA: sulfotransferase [Rhizomicrobium sp.]|nr:sulfotransferase [Rhizomicrobium sp.]